MDVSRYVDVTELQFEVEFITPCFLGGADGKAEIRTAPFKSLIRRWWRIANGHLSPEELWKKESELFGSTQKNPDVVKANKGKKTSEKQPEIFGKSKVELKIIDKERCTISSNKNLLFPQDKLEHPEVSRPIEVEAYLGMGPIFWNKEIKKQEYRFRYIEPNSKICFNLSCSEKNKQELISSIFLIHLFGTIGARSHNGWGSIIINPINFKFSPEDIFRKFKNWNDIVNDNKHYPHIIGKDEKGVLCWKTTNYRSWTEAFSEIGNIYISLMGSIKSNCYDLNCRKLFGFATGKERLPSHFTIKIVKTKVKTGDGPATRYYGIIIHLPYIMEFGDWKSQSQMNSSKFIHNYLDKNLEGWQRNVTGGNSK